MTGAVLITRPRVEAKRLARDVRARGFETFIEPLFDIVPLDVRLPDLTKYQALVFTSVNGLTAFTTRSEDRSLPVFTVGDATADRARERGFKDVRTGGGDLAALNMTLADAGLEADVPVLHVSGVHVAGNVEIPGVPVQRLAAYRAEKAKRLGPACREMFTTGGFSSALFYSPRTARCFSELLEACGQKDAVSSIKALCISDAVVKCLQHLPWQDVQVARTPSGDEMLALLDRLSAEDINLDESKI